MDKYNVIDNFLEPTVFKDLKNYIESDTFIWRFSDRCTHLYEHEEAPDYDFYFYNLIFDHNMICTDQNTWNFINLVLNKLDMKCLRRCKINSYIKTPKIIHHKKHIDYDYSHKGAIFSLNTNDGYTVLKDGSEIKSIENRLLLFNPSEEHNSTSCTDSNRRLNINFNYF